MNGLTRGRWLDRWHPDDPEFWEREGANIARKNLIFSVLAEHFGFSIWVLWTIIVINLANVGITLTISELFWLTAVPNLVGAALRIPYTFAIPTFGGRAWTTISALLLLIPATLVATVVPSGWLAAQPHSTQFWVLLACAATAGVGGGNFSSSMANISFFYPEAKQGLALGINAAGGNLGVAVTQLLVPLVITIGVPTAAVQLPGHDVHLAYAGLIWMPCIILVALGAARYMDSIPDAKADGASYRMTLRELHTWMLSLLYIGTFGTFIGFSFALPLVIKNTFPEFLAQHPFIATYLAGLAFVGALTGSIARPLGGWLADRIGGAHVTVAAFAGMTLATGAAIIGITTHSFAIFFGSYVLVFALSGIGNGSTYRMIPAIFARLGAKHATGTAPSAVESKRRAAAAIGIAGAVGAFGGFLIQVVLRQASLDVSALMSAATTSAQRHTIALEHTDWSVPALVAFIGAYLILGALTWALYVRVPLESSAHQPATPALSADAA